MKPGWKRPRDTREMSISEDETHVWLLPCRQSGARLDSLWRELDEAERSRANRFHFEKDRSRFVASRAMVRRVLSCYLRCPAAEVSYDIAEGGKPRLADRHASSIRFNQSISGDWALLALTPDRELGVDIEQIDGRRADRDIVNGFFAPGEVRALEALPEHEWMFGFFNCWARKEAFIKSTGEGLSRPLDSFEVSIATGQAPSVLSVAGYADADKRWQMADLAEVPGYASALVVTGPVGRLQCFTWPGP
jgi:4'-phosphopantetheinyl transferase